MAATKPKSKTETAAPAAPQTQIAIRGPRLPYPAIFEAKFGIDSTAWRALVDAIFPLAESIEAIYLALSYCKARRLDPFKRCIHIVPIWSKKLGRNIPTIWPGIAELRTTAFRTGEYLGKDAVKFGDDITQTVGSIELTFPAWAQVTVHRFQHGRVVDYSGDPVFWLETYATRAHDDDTPNEMWASRPRGQLAKCAEAAALRAAFPEDVGGELIGDEVAGRKPPDPNTVEGKVVETESRIDALTERMETENARTDETMERAADGAAAEDATSGAAAGSMFNPVEQLHKLAIELGCPLTTAGDFVATSQSEADPVAYIRSKPWQAPPETPPAAAKKEANQTRAF